MAAAASNPSSLDIDVAGVPSSNHTLDESEPSLAVLSPEPAASDPTASIRSPSTQASLPIPVPSKPPASEPSIAAATLGSEDDTSGTIAVGQNMSPPTKSSNEEQNNGGSVVQNLGKRAEAFSPVSQTSAVQDKPGAILLPQPALSDAQNVPDSAHNDQPSPHPATGAVNPVTSTTIAETAERTSATDGTADGTTLEDDVPLPTAAAARAAFTAHMSSQGAAALAPLSQRAAAIAAAHDSVQQQREQVEQATGRLAVETDRATRETEKARSALKEIGDVDNWASMLGGQLDVLEETLRLVEAGADTTDPAFVTEGADGTERTGDQPPGQQPHADALDHSQNISTDAGNNVDNRTLLTAEEQHDDQISSLSQAQAPAQAEQARSPGEPGYRRKSSWWRFWNRKPGQTTAVSRQ